MDTISKEQSFGLPAEPSWRDVLTSENIPLNTELVFHRQNRGVNAVLLDDKHLKISQKSKRDMGRLLEYYIYDHHSGGGMVVDESDITNPRSNVKSVISIGFHNGLPTGRKAASRCDQYFEREDRSQSENLTEDLGFTIE